MKKMEEEEEKAKKRKSEKNHKSQITGQQKLTAKEKI